MSTTNKAWAAGFFDGEGCTSISRKGRNKQIQMYVSQSADTTLLDKFQQTVGIGRVLGPYRPSNPRAKDKYTWHASKLSDTLIVMRMLWPYLGTSKKQQFIRAYREIRKYKRSLLTRYTMAKLPELPVSAMFPSGGVAPYGRPSMGTNEQQEAGAPMADKGGDKDPNGDNPSIADSVSMFGKGPDVVVDRSCPRANPTPEMPGAN